MRSLHRLAIQVRAASGWRNVTTYSFDPDKRAGLVDSREDRMKDALLGLHAWRQYHLFTDSVLRIAEEFVDDKAGGHQWIEARP